ncbi:glycosyltransferase [Halioxenophilus aromaticivorans]|uniref:GDP-mannose--glycolipid 4-beta-D-mannosyltransferase n=1 Tax=Halioxenophilus aromaticivorans TaxID=1306992 RepID=A0AAV3U2Z6_9ALTE
MASDNGFKSADPPLKVLAWPMEKNIDANPYNHILYQAMAEFAYVGEFHSRKMHWAGENILHVHWPDMLLRGRRTWRIKIRFRRLAKMVAKLKRNGGKLVWTVHNLKPHNPTHPQLADRLMAEFVSWVDGFIFLTDESRGQFLAAFPAEADKPYCVTPHVHYRHFYQPGRPTVTRQSLSIPNDATVLLMFGKLRHHKGLQQLLQAHKGCEANDVYLVIAGEPSDKVAAQALLAQVAGNTHVRVQLQHIAPQQVPDYFALADAVVLPYVKILNSGTAVLALSFGLPIIAPAMGSLTALREQFGKQQVFLYTQEFTVGALKTALHWLASAPDSEPHRLIETLSPMEPRAVALATASFFQSLLAQ